MVSSLLAGQIIEILCIRWTHVVRLSLETATAQKMRHETSEKKENQSSYHLSA